MADRVSQESVEVLYSTSTAKAHVSQVAVEALVKVPTGGNRTSQVAVEVLYRAPVKIDPAGETDTAQLLDYALASASTVTITPATETDTAVALTWQPGYRLTPATETDQAVRLVPWMAIEPALEHDEALQLTYGLAGVRLTQTNLEVVYSPESSDAQLTLAYLEVLTVRGHNLHVWYRF